MGAKIPTDFNSKDGIGARAHPGGRVLRWRGRTRRGRSNERTLKIRLHLHLSRGAKRGEQCQRSTPHQTQKGTLNGDKGEDAAAAATEPLHSDPL